MIHPISYNAFQGQYHTNIGAERACGNIKWYHLSHDIFFHSSMIFVDLDWLSMCLVDWSLLKLHNIVCAFALPLLLEWPDLMILFYTLLVLLSCVLVFYSMVLRRGRDYVARKKINFLNM